MCNSGPPCNDTVKLIVNVFSKSVCNDLVVCGNTGEVI